MSKTTDETLAAELFDLVEYDQGKGFISDGVGALPRKRIFAVARGALRHSEIVVRKLKRWLKKYGEA